MPGRALILTGPSGVGKTAVGLRLQDLLDTPWLFYEVDRTQPQLPKDATQLATVETDNLLRRCLLRAGRVYLDAGFSLIIEIGLSGQADQRIVEETLAGVDLTIVVLTCEPETRERHLAGRHGPVDDNWARETYRRQTQPPLHGSHVVATDDRTITEVAHIVASFLGATIRTA